MKKNIKCTFSLILSAWLTVSLFPLWGISVKAASEGGMEFQTALDADVYRMPEKLDVYPNTFEAWICLSDTITGRAGGILSNYIGSGNNTIIFEVHQNGAPRFYAASAEGKTIDVKFTTVDVRTNDWVHLAVVREAKAVVCYVNGAEAARKELSFVYNPKVLDERFVFGGDNRPINQYPFRGKIKSFAMYTDALNADAVADSYRNGVDTKNTSLLAYYDLSTAPAGNKIEDLSGKGNFVELSSNAQPEINNKKTAAKEYAYSFAVVGDTQYIVYDDAKDGTLNTANIYDWILDNIEKKKIQYVFGLGDITDTMAGNAAEWQIAKEQLAKLDGKIPYSLVRGNHDDSIYMNKYVATDAYKSQFRDPDIADQSACFYKAGKIDNAYTKFNVGDTKYLLFTLDYGAEDDILAWAEKIISSNPQYRVIITTHAYLNRDGTPFSTQKHSPDITGLTAKNNGAEMWDKLISKYRNIFLVLSGHDNNNGDIVMTQTKGIHGNTVTQMLIDPQSLDYDPNDVKESKYGMVAMLYFSEDGKKVSVEYISTCLTAKNSDGNDVLHKDKNQFDFTLISDEGNGIVSTEFVCRTENVDTYRILYTNGTCQEFSVTNGEKGDKGDPGTVVYTDTAPVSNSSEKSSRITAALAIGGTALASNIGLTAYILSKRKHGV